MRGDNMRLLIIVIAISAFLAGSLVGEAIMSARADGGLKLEIIEVEVTAYSPSPAQTDSKPFQTASGKVVKPTELEQLRYVAVSRDLAKKYGLEWGDTVWIAFTVEDTMNGRITEAVDLFMRSQGLAKKFGRQKRMVIIERKIKL